VTGPAALREWMARERLSAREAARRLGVTHPTIGHWISGRYVPEPAHAYRLSRRAGVPVSAWEKR
jgi:transcriptional regulator with XRE-family HTH domain